MAETPLRSTLAALRRRPGAWTAPELARSLFHLSVPPSAPTAQRILAAFLGCTQAELAGPIATSRLIPARPAADLACALGHAEFCVLDLETTGLGQAASILEIGAVHVSGARALAHFSCLVRPSGSVPSRISELTGIDDPLVADAPAESEALAALRRWLGPAEGALPVAHNAGFDAGFVARAEASHGLTLLPGPWLCTRRLAQRLVPGLPSYSLAGLCVRFGIHNLAPHRALGDAEATARLLLALLRIARARGAETTADLLQMQRGKSPRLLRKKASEQTARPPA